MNALVEDSLSRAVPATPSSHARHKGKVVRGLAASLCPEVTAMQPVVPAAGVPGNRSRHLGFWLSVGLITVAASLLGGTAGTSQSLAPFLVTGALACLAGWRRDPVAARVIYVGGIVGAAAVAWAAGPVGVEPRADPAMRSSYYVMLIVIAAGFSAVLGAGVVVAGYWLGRLATRRRNLQ